MSCNKPYHIIISYPFSSHSNTHMSFHESPKKNRFIRAIFSGHPIAEAAEQNGIPYSTATMLWQKFVNTSSTHAQPHSGWPTKAPHIFHVILSKRARSTAMNHFGSWQIVLDLRCQLLQCIEYLQIKGGIGERLIRLFCLLRIINKHEKPGQHSTSPWKWKIGTTSSDQMSVMSMLATRRALFGSHILLTKFFMKIVLYQPSSSCQSM